jgi:FdhE protein
MAQATVLFEELAAADPSVAALARLQAAALEAADDPSWADGVPDLSDRRAPRGAEPLLHGATLTIDVERTRALLRELAAVLAAERAEAERLGPLLASAQLDVLELVSASVGQDHLRLEAIATAAEVDPGVLSIVAHTATLPLLLACGRRAAGTLQAASWSHGYCPVCAAWPILAEVRGLERDLVLRCGRCAGGWRFEHLGCVFCGNRDHRSQGYFAAERERESRRAVICDHCRGYLKTQATLGALDPPELLLRDLQSLELDVTAVEHGYARPDSPGWDLTVRIEPGRRAAPTR